VNTSTHEGEWRKSSFSGSSGQCVEVAWVDEDRGQLRDSKNAGPRLSVDLRQLAAHLKRHD
jgi:hypothetical protein